MESSVQKSQGNIAVYIALVILAVFLAVGGYLMGSGQGLKTKKTQITSDSSAFVRVQSLLSDHKALVTKGTIQISYAGVLKSIEPGKSWTIERDNQMVTIYHEGTSQIRYFLSSGTTKVQPESIGPESINVGDNVVVTTLIDVETGVQTVGSVVKIPPPSASPAAPPM